MVKFFFSFEFLTLSWTLGEIIILAALYWVYLELARKGKKRFIPFLLVCIPVFIFCVWLHLGAQPIIRNRLYHWGELQRTYHILVWDFFCTLWAIIEGIAMIYGLSIYYLLKLYLIDKNKPMKRLTIDHAALKGVLILLLSIIYFLYHYYAFDIYFKHSLKFSELRNILVFYRRIIGLFWVAFEGVMAIFIFRLNLLLRSTLRGEITIG